MDKIQLRGSMWRAPSDDSRVVTFRASTPTIDRHGTKIIPTGIDTAQFDRNPVFLWGHDGYGGLVGAPNIDSVIGRVIAHRKSAGAFDIDVEFAPKSVNERAEQAFRLVKSGFLNAVSIGFSPRIWHEEKPEDENAPPVIVFDEVDLLEVSLVPIPSNPDALALTRHLFGGKPDVEQLGAIDALLRVGKVLSSSNKAKLKNAVNLINEVLASAMDEDDNDQNSAPPGQAPAEHGVSEAAQAAIRAWIASTATARALRAI